VKYISLQPRFNKKSTVYRLGVQYWFRSYKLFSIQKQ